MKPMALQFRAIASIALLCLPLMGCVGAGAVPEQRFYRLPEPRPAAVSAPLFTTPLFTTPLGIPRLRASGLYHERAILYFDPQTPLSLRPYHYHFWHDSPTIMIRDHLAAYLRNAGAATEIVRFQDEGQAGQQLHGRLIRFEREVMESRMVVHIALELSLEAGREVLMPPRRYALRREVADRSLHSTVTAFGEGLETIYAQLLADLRELAQRPVGR